MITAVDTNVLVALLGGTAEAAAMARRSLEKAGGMGTLTVSPVVYAELVAAPGRDAEEVDTFLRSTHVAVDWVLGETYGGRRLSHTAGTRARDGDSQTIGAPVGFSPIS